MDSGGGEGDVVRVARRCVSDFGVDRFPFSVQPFEGLASLRERAAGAFDASPCGVDVDLHQHGDRTLAQRSARALGEDGAAAEREHVRLEPLEHLAHDLFFRAPKAGLALLEELRDGRARAPFDLVVEIEKRPPDAERNLRRERRLACAHEADERNVPLQGP